MKTILLLLTIILISGCTERIACTEEALICPDGVTTVGRTGPDCEFAECPGLCGSDADCVPATCCHPDMCVPMDQEPRCDGMVCTAECVPGTMDCGQGHCGCMEGACSAVMDEPIV